MALTSPKPLTEKLKEAQERFGKNWAKVPQTWAVACTRVKKV
jgi:hypothetical protein